MFNRFIVLNQTKKFIKNMRDGYHLNSKYWQDWKKNLPKIQPHDFLFQLRMGMVLSDAGMSRVSREALMKFEQGENQKEFLFHLFEMCKMYRFITAPGIRYHIHGQKKGTIKSYWFKTFRHESFSNIWDLFYINNKKVIQKGLILNHLNEIGLAYWVMGDGSLHREGRTLTLNTQGFSLEENQILSRELNEKFGFHTKVIKHKDTMNVIQFRAKDGNKLHDRDLRKKLCN